jgi:hypothetical protein
MKAFLLITIIVFINLAFGQDIKLDEINKDKKTFIKPTKNKDFSISFRPSMIYLSGNRKNVNEQYRYQLIGYDPQTGYNTVSTGTLGELTLNNFSPGTTEEGVRFIKKFKYQMVLGFETNFKKVISPKYSIGIGFSFSRYNRSFHIPFDPNNIDPWMNSVWISEKYNYIGLPVFLSIKKNENLNFDFGFRYTFCNVKRYDRWRDDWVRVKPLDYTESLSVGLDNYIQTTVNPLRKIIPISLYSTINYAITENTSIYLSGIIGNEFFIPASISGSYGVTINPSEGKNALTYPFLLKFGLNFEF